MGKNLPVPDDSKVLIYQAESGETRLEAPYGRALPSSVKTVNEHLIHVYDEGELTPEATIRKFRIVQTEGARRVC
jgi:hypothetical protein